MENTFEEDYPEYCKKKEPQKTIWIQKYCIWIDGTICEDLHWSVNTNDMDKIGNLFDTKEEAEKAVEKLKAWKRLKDKGFIFCGNDCINKNNVIYFEFGERPLTQSEADEADKDLDLLFGGEE